MLDVTFGCIACPLLGSVTLTLPPSSYFNVEVSKALPMQAVVKKTTWLRAQQLSLPDADAQFLSRWHIVLGTVPLDRSLDQTSRWSVTVASETQAARGPQGQGAFALLIVRRCEATDLRLEYRLCHCQVDGRRPFVAQWSRPTKTCGMINSFSYSCDVVPNKLVYSLPL